MKKLEEVRDNLKYNGDHGDAQIVQKAIDEIKLLKNLLKEMLYPKGE